MLQIGSHAPDFQGVTQSGHVTTLSELLGAERLVLYFYPKDFTRVCTTQACLFRDVEAELRALGAHLAGVSSDSEAAHQRFAEEYKIAFPLIADSDHKIARAYDVDRRLLGFAKRVTYVISPNRRVEAAFHHELSARKHLDDLRELLLRN